MFMVFQRSGLGRDVLHRARLRFSFRYVVALVVSAVVLWALFVSTTENSKELEIALDPLVVDLVEDQVGWRPQVRPLFARICNTFSIA